MNKIKKIDILNFKVFRYREVFDLEAKNLLVYGTNGSGKSSLFWSLYTFLQSSGKDKGDVEKYFNPDDQRNLRNIFSAPTDPSYIKITVVDTATDVETTYTIGGEKDAAGALKYNINTIGVPEIEKANLASDFINYRLLLNFYNASHRDQTDLIWVFVRDIFPFFNNDINENLLKNFYYLIDNTPEVQKKQQKAARGITRLGKSTTDKILHEYETKRKKFNDDLTTFFNDINSEGNKFLKKHFLNDQDVLKFEIGFKKYEHIDPGTGAKSYTYDDLRLSDSGEALYPYITLNVWQKDKAGADVDIWRPHSFLNEAKLTQFSLSIRLAALKIRLQRSPNLFKVLVVDDLLISLDMSNRLVVLEIILKEFSDYQLIILTHDKGFFDIISLKTKDKNKEWLKFEFYDTQDEGNPIVKINVDFLDRAKQYLADNELDLSAVMLRKKAENLLKIYLDPELKHLTIFDTKDTLDEFFKKAKKHPYNLQYDKLSKVFGSEKFVPADLDNFDNTNATLNAAVTGPKRNELMAFRLALYTQSKEHIQWLIDSKQMRADLTKAISDMEDLAKRILNPGAHAGGTPLFKKEIEDAIALLEDISKKLGIPK